MKYKLTANTKTIGNTTLYQIQALKDFGLVKAGELGGWVEKESNLSQEGGAWVFDNARVSDTAQVSGNALVSGNAWVFGDAQVFGDARVSGSAQVFGDAQVSGNAQVEH